MDVPSTSTGPPEEEADATTVVPRTAGRPALTDKEKEMKSIHNQHTQQLTEAARAAHEATGDAIAVFKYNIMQNKMAPPILFGCFKDSSIGMHTADLCSQVLVTNCVAAMGGNADLVSLILCSLITRRDYYLVFPIIISTLHINNEQTTCCRL